MSLLGKKWVVRDRPLSEWMNGSMGESEGRTIDPLDGPSVTFHDPFLMRDMPRAVERLERAIEAGERIVVFGDYDVDGISGTALLVQTLRHLGATVSYRLPDRQEGYGLNMAWIERFKALDLGVLITVDSGISNHKEIEAASEAGIDVIVTDHHTIPPQLPETAVALLHPALPGDTYPFPHLAGSGVAYKLAVALIQTLKSEEESWIWRQKLADLASLGTVADVMPLIGENRWIVKQGLDQMKQTEWTGLTHLLKVAGVDEIVGHDSDLIGFRIGPRLNAAGRLDTPYYALQLLLDENGCGATLAQKLESLNQERRALVEKAMEQAERVLQEEGRSDRKVIVVWSPEWPAGIIGLIAARLSEKYHRPTIVLEDRGDTLVASCRSPEYFNIATALQALSSNLETHGGHAAAAGFKILKQNLSAFEQELQVYAENMIQIDDLTPLLTIDHQIELSQITFDLLDRLSQRAPFGPQNPKPLFLIRGLKPLDLQTVGREHRHLRFRLETTSGGPAPRSSTGVSSGETAPHSTPSFKPRLSAIAFRFGSHYSALQKGLEEGQRLDGVFELEQDTWNGRKRIQLKVVDLRIAEF